MSNLTPKTIGKLRRALRDLRDHGDYVPLLQHLSESGATERAEFVRLQQELAEYLRHSEDGSIAGLPANKRSAAHSVKARSEALFNEHGKNWVPEINGADHFAFRGGVVAGMEIALDKFLKIEAFLGPRKIAEWKRQRVHRLFQVLPNLAELSLTSVKPKDLELIASFPQFKRVNNLKLQGNEDLDSGFHALNGREHLEKLEVTFNSRLPFDFDALIPLPRLKEFSLNAFTLVQDHDLETVARNFPNLTSLKFENARISQEAIQALPHIFPNIEELKLSQGPTDPPFGAMTFVTLRQLQNLKSLSLADTNLEPDALAELSQLSSLTKLDLHEVKLNKTGLEEIGAMHGLTDLNLHNSSVRGEDLGVLSGLSNLRSLDLGRNPLSKTGIQGLTALKNLSSLDLSSTNLEGAQLVPLRTMKYLAELDLRGATESSEDEINTLAITNPNLRVIRTSYLRSSIQNGLRKQGWNLHDQTAVEKGIVLTKE